jgi:hypothetical protein
MEMPPMSEDIKILRPNQHTLPSETELSASDLEEISGGAASARCAVALSSGPLTGSVKGGSLTVQGVQVSKVFLALNSPFDPKPLSAEQELTAADPEEAMTSAAS